MLAGESRRSSPIVSSGGPTSRQPRANRHPYPVDQRFAAARPRAQRFQAGVHHRHHLQIAARHGAFQHVRPEHEGVGRMGEMDRSAEGSFVLPGVRRSRMLETDHIGRPGPSPGPSRKMLRNMPSDSSASWRRSTMADARIWYWSISRPSCREARRSSECCWWQGKVSVMLCSAGPQRGRRHRQVAPQPEVVGPELVAEPEPEVFVAGLVRSFLERAGRSSRAGIGRVGAPAMEGGDPGVAEDAVDIPAAALDLLDDTGRRRMRAPPGGTAPAVEGSRLPGCITPERSGSGVAVIGRPNPFPAASCARPECSTHRHAMPARPGSRPPWPANTFRTPSLRKPMRIAG